MTEGFDPNPELDNPDKPLIVPGEITSEEYKSWEEKIADEIDLEAMTLMQLAVDNPAVKDTVEYQVRVAELRGKQDMLELTTRSFADRVSEKGVESILKHVLGEDTGQDEDS